MSKEAMKLALDALESPWNAPYVDGCDLALGRRMKAITALREELVKPDFWEGYVPEPVKPAQLPFGVGGGLVAIKTLLSRDPCVHANTAIQMIDAILAEQPAQQEPVAWLVECGGDSALVRHTKNFPGIFAGNEFNKRPLVFGDKSPPAQRTWVGLTDVEWMNIVNKDHAWFGQRPEDVAHEVAKLIEAKLKEKNT